MSFMALVGLRLVGITSWLKKLPWQVWAILAALILLFVVYRHGEHKGEVKGAAKVTAQVEKDHTRTVAEAVADTGKAQATATEIGDQVRHSNQLATDFVQSKIEDMHHAIESPPVAAGGAPAPVDTVGVSASIDAVIDRANRAAEAADQEP